MYGRKMASCNFVLFGKKNETKITQIYEQTNNDKMRAATTIIRISSTSVKRKPINTSLTLDRNLSLTSGSKGAAFIMIMYMYII